MNRTNFLLDEWEKIYDNVGVGTITAKASAFKKLSVDEALRFRETVPPSPLEMRVALSAGMPFKDYQIKTESKYVQIPVELSGSESCFVTRRVPYDRVTISGGKVTGIEDHGDCVVLDLWSGNFNLRMGMASLRSGDFHIVCDRGYHSLTSEGASVTKHVLADGECVRILFNDDLIGYLNHDTTYLKPRNNSWATMHRLIAPLCLHRSNHTVIHAVYAPVTEGHGINFVFQKFIEKPSTDRTIVDVAKVSNYASILA